MRSILRVSVSIGFLGFFYVAFAVLMVANADPVPIPNCHHLTACSAPNSPPTGCDVNTDWIQCDGSHRGRVSSCINSVANCVFDCYCLCNVEDNEFTGSVIQYMTCQDQLVSFPTGCSGCPCRNEGQSCGAYNVCCSGAGACLGGVCKRPNTIGECNEAGWYWSSISTCEDTSICPWGQMFDSGASLCCPDPPPEYQCDAIIPETNCPYNFVQGCAPSPVLVDVLGNGFQMTDAANGVDFDIDGNSNHVKELLSWTQASTDDAWLVLDRNGNGVVDSGREMFGNHTAQSQPPGTPRNGFLALAEYDKAAKGGNGDGVINSIDAVFINLRLWQDSNHNGISEAGELHKLEDLGLPSIDLDYKESKKTDQFGNQFRYRAKVKDTHNAQLGRWAWDVFLLKQ
jgi:hypothetical protein